MSKRRVVTAGLSRRGGSPLPFGRRRRGQEPAGDGATLRSHIPGS